MSCDPSLLSRTANDSPWGGRYLPMCASLRLEQGLFQHKDYCYAQIPACCIISSSSSLSVACHEVLACQHLTKCVVPTVLPRRRLCMGGQSLCVSLLLPTSQNTARQAACRYETLFPCPDRKVRGQPHQEMYYWIVCLEVLHTLLPLSFKPL